MEYSKRYIKSYGVFEDKDPIDRFPQTLTEIHEICEKYGISNYSVSDDNIVDVDGDVDIFSKSLTSIPLKFGRVSGYFSCDGNKLSSLYGSPNYVGGVFSCSNSTLKSLKYSPEYVGDVFVCSHNELENLIGVSSGVSHLLCQHNKIYTFRGLRDSVKYLECDYNPISYVFSIFDETGGNFELFNELDIIRGKDLIVDRLIDFVDMVAPYNIDKSYKRGHIISSLISTGYNLI